MRVLANRRGECGRVLWVRADVDDGRASVVALCALPAKGCAGGTNSNSRGCLLRPLQTD